MTGFIIGVIMGASLAVLIIFARLELVTRFAKWFCEKKNCHECPYHGIDGCKIGNPGGWRL